MRGLSMHSLSGCLTNRSQRREPASEEGVGSALNREDQLFIGTGWIGLEVGLGLAGEEGSGGLEAGVDGGRGGPQLPLAIGRRRKGNDVGEGVGEAGPAHGGRMTTSQPPMEMGAGAQPGGTARPEPIAGTNSLADADIDPLEVGVEGAPAAGVAELHRLAEDRIAAANVDDDASGGGAHRSAGWGGDIDAGMPTGVFGDRSTAECRSDGP